MKLPVAIFLIAFSIGGCSPSDGPSTDPVLFQVEVDSIAHVPSVALGDTADIKFFGTVGTDGCHSFSHFLVIRQPASVDFAVWGKRTMTSFCGDVMVYLNGNTYGYIPSQRGMLQISVHQPDGSTLKDSLLVE
ncbi:MAG: hypothetical protein HYZ01_06750 [Ignavibacteriales bacterium]|nr:hypothetical protein [Ignavibacteriales bacterium]